MVSLIGPRLKLVASFPIERNMSLLDYGCGNGTITQSFASRVKEVVGYDNDRETIRKAKQKESGVHFTDWLPQRFFDAAIMSYVVHDAGLESIREVDVRIAKNGTLVIADFDMKGMSYAEFIRRSIGRDELREISADSRRTYQNHTRFGFEDYLPFIANYKTLRLERVDPETSKYFIWFGKKKVQS